MSVLDNLVELVKFRIGLGDADDTAVTLALQLALGAFNIVPSVTYFTFEDEENIAQLSDLLVTYAAYVLLTRKAAQAISDRSFQDLVQLSREVWSNWDSQVSNLKQSDSFYEDFVKE